METIEVKEGLVMITEAVIAIILIERATSSYKAHRALKHMSKKQIRTLVELATSNNTVSKHQLAKVQSSHYNSKMIGSLCKAKLIKYGKHIPKPKQHFYTSFLNKLAKYSLFNKVVRMLVHHQQIIYWKFHKRIFHITGLGLHVLRLISSKFPSFYKDIKDINKYNHDLWVRKPKHRIKKGYKKIKKGIKRHNNKKKSIKK